MWMIRLRREHAAGMSGWWHREEVPKQFVRAIHQVNFHAQQYPTAAHGPIESEWHA